ncbi:MAG: DUF2267 domain-containing protein [Streptomyces sp.]|uniref:DUF2267 domain-containing protein n=1 Tax=Streptomyces sp. B93 TaxID=2824875 RepID=UPI0019B48468|nr:DUF2267 domain-containing protein [Streptomyces sp. B93]MBC7273366.1 DUF2267 domain-containing protein [Streptomyces sp.]MBQ1089319.1 DUF2267 domain-containing protein [Streptomyces sp. B93]
MQHDEMIGKVQALTRLPGRGPAERATQAVLTTLAERLPSGLAGHMAAQLPPGLAAPVRQAAEAPTERFDLTTLAGRIAARAGTDEDMAVREASAVFEVLDAALAPELMDHVAEALPADIRELLPAGRAGEERP